MDLVFQNNETVRFIGTVFGWVNVVFCLLIYISNKRSRILALKLSSDVFSSLNLIMCSFRAAGALACLTAIFREIIFFFRTKKKWADHRIWLFVVIAALSLTSVADFALRGAFNPLALLPTVGSMIAAVGLFSKNTLRMKILVLIGSIPYLFYNIYSIESGIITVNPNIPGIAATSLQLISLTIGLLHESEAGRKRKAPVSKRDGEEENIEASNTPHKV